MRLLALARLELSLREGSRISDAGFRVFGYLQRGSSGSKLGLCVTGLVGGIHLVERELGANLLSIECWVQRQR